MGNSEVLFKGTIILEIDDSETEAKLTFRPGEEHGEWTREGLFHLFEEKHIKEALDPGALEKAIDKFSRLKEGELSFVVAKGKKPTAAEPGKIIWEKFEMPEDKKAEAERIITEAPSPEVYEVRERRVKVERVEKKKGILPFLHGKEEKTVHWETKEERRRVGIEEKVEDFGFVSEGMLLGTVQPGKQGAEGRTLTGKSIKAPEASEIKVLLGNGVKMSGKEIRAEIPGLARRGSNWVDIIAYLSHKLKIKSSGDNSECLMDFSPGFADSTMPDVSSVLPECEKLGFKRDILKSEEEIREVVAESIANGESLKDYSLCRTEDGKIIINVTPDKLKAELTLIKGRGQGKKLSLKAISEKINSYKFKGMDIARVKKDLLDFYNGKEKKLKNYVLVEGTKPEKGEDGEIRCEFNFISEENAAKLKKQAEERLARLGDIESLKEFPISSVEKIGFVEKGAKVASIVPPTGGRPGKDVFGNTIPGEKGKEAAYKIFENLQASAAQITSKIDGLIESREINGVLELRARLHKNGNARISLSDDAMKAFLTIEPPLGPGAPVNYEAVKKIVDEEGIKKGLNEEALKKAIEKAEKGEAVENMLIAQGKRPVNDTGKKPKFHVQFASGKRVLIRESGRADYKNKDLITTVTKDQLLAEVDKSEIIAEDGWDVMGNVLPAVKQAETVLEAGKNVRKEEGSDGTLKFFAERGGELIYERNTLEVLEVHTIDGDVGVETGNINFAGSVVVKGSVQDGYRVIAGGDIVVGENVQAALLSAEGSIIVKNGVKGAGKAILRAKKDIEAGFIEQATVLAAGDVKVSGSCLRCRIKSNSKVTLDTDKGSLIGGEVRAKNGIGVTNLGSESWAKTTVSFGQDYLVGDRLQLEEKEIEKLKILITKLDAAMKKIERANKGNTEDLERLRKEKVRALKVMENRSHRVFTLKERYEEHIPSEITVRESVYPGVVLESHGRFYEFKKPKKGVTFFFNEKLGSIEEKK